MKQISFFFLVAATLIAAVSPLKAQSGLTLQDIYNLMDDPGANYYQVQKTAELYFENRPKGKGTGYKQFKRWEAEMKYWIDEQGNRINPRFIHDEALLFEQKYANKSVSALSANWVELGPTYWNKTSSWAPGLGRIDAVEVDPQNNNHILIGSPEGGVWKTINGGTTWSSLTDGLTYMQIGDVSIDPNNSNTYYIGTLGAGMLKSTDGGVTLNQVNSGFSSSASVRKIIVDPTNSNNVLLASSSGVYRSTNGGSSWTLSKSGSFYDIEFKPGNPATVYSCGTGFYVSTNSGSTFTAVTSGIQYSSAMRLAVTAANPNVVYIVQCNGSVFGAVYKSTNSGTSFTATVTGNSANGTNYFGYSPNGTDTQGQGSYNIDIAVSPTDENEVHIAGIITWKSTNGGTSFTATTEWTYPNTRGYTHCDMHALEYAGNTLYTGSDGGIFMSTDKGDNFTNISSGLGIRMFYRLGCSPTDPIKITAGAQDNGSSILTSTGWIDWLGADGQEGAIDNTNSNIIYGSSQYGDLYKSTNGGTTYSGLTAPASNGDWTTPLILDPIAANTLYVGYTEIYKSTNGGSSWTQISNFGTGNNFKYMAIAPSNSSYIYVAQGTSIYKTTNGGTSWTSIAAGLGGLSINGIAVHNSDPNKVAVATSSSKIYTSANGGSTWTNSTGNFPAVTARCLAYQNGATEGIYVGTNSGVYYQDNTMSNWISYKNLLPKVAVNELEIQYGAGKIRAATYGRGIWECDLYSPAVTPVAAFSAPSGVCINQPVNFTDQSTNSPTAWSWIFPGGIPATSTQQNPSNVIWNTPGTYTVALSATNSAGNNSVGHVIVVHALPVAGVSPNVSIQAGQNTTLTASGGTGYSWTPSAGLNNTTGSSVVASPSVTTTYSVIVTDANGCTGLGQVTVTVNAVGVFDPANNSILMNIYPNPNNGQFTIVAGGNLTSDFLITVENMLGQVIYSEKTTPGNLLSKTVDLKGVKKGIYFLQIKGDGAEGCSKIIVE